MQTISPPSAASAQPAARTELSVRGMNCSNCVRHVTEALQGVSGVASATVSLETHRATIRWAPGAIGRTAQLIEAVEGAGYQATGIDALAATSAEPTAGHESLWSNSVVLGIVPTVLMMIGEWGLRLSGHAWYHWVSFALAALVQFGPGRHFYRGAWNQLKVGSSNMDTLVALGSTTAFVYSVGALFTGVGGHLYFMEAAAIISLISAGHWMEARVSARASNSLKHLMHLAPETAALRGADGSEKQVAVADLKPGDIVVLKAGDRVPTDGEAIEGHSTLDESMLTGESMPIEKTAGSKLYAGTVNQSGRLLMRVSSVGEETALAHIVAAVQRAQTSRANIQRLGDRVSNVFVPVVVLVAATTALGWGLLPEQAHQVNQWLSQFLWTAHLPPSPLAGAVIAAAAVLIIACPCAMGLATPAAIMAAANAAAKRGILIRDGVALEKAGNVTSIAFDKTGTLTEGRPKVVASQIFDAHLPKDTNNDHVGTLAASLGSMSNHPLSKAVSELSRMREDLTGLQELSGRGVSATKPAANGPGHLLQLGSLRWLREESIDTNCAAAFGDQWMNQGATVVGFSVDRRLVALFALKDPLKAGARDVIRRLSDSSRSGNLSIHLVSGDSRQTVDAIARELGMDPGSRGSVFAEIRPDQKAEIVRKLQQQGERVAFVGDGINDAPALEQSDLGIAVSQASDIARNAADIVLLRSEVDAIPESLGLARATLRTIKQNLFWAFFYNALGVPLAALGFMSPVLCAAAMGVSDLVVIGNALRLRHWKLPN